MPKRVRLEVRIEGTEVVRMRKAILSLGGNAVDVITVSPVSGSSLVTVFVKVQRDKLAAVMSAITDCVPGGQFGPVGAA